MAATGTFRGDESRRRCGRDVDVPRIRASTWICQWTRTSRPRYAVWSFVALCFALFRGPGSTGTCGGRANKVDDTAMKRKQELDARIAREKTEGLFRTDAKDPVLVELRGLERSVAKARVAKDLDEWDTALTIVGAWLALAAVAVSIASNWRVVGPDQAFCWAQIGFSLMMFQSWNGSQKQPSAKAQIATTVLDALGSRLGVDRRDLAHVSMALARHVAHLQDTRKRTLDKLDTQRGTTTILGAERKEAAFVVAQERREVKCMVRVFQMFYEKLNEGYAQGRMKFFFCGGLTELESRALEQFHASTGARVKPCGSRGAAPPPR